MNIPLPGASVKLFLRRWRPSDIMPALAANRWWGMLMAQRSGAGTAQDLDRVLADLRALSEVYVWPLDRRPKDGAGRYGSPHAKFAVADETTLLVSSANLTEYAFNFNMELGLLVRGGDLPGRVVQHLRRLVE